MMNKNNVKFLSVLLALVLALSSLTVLPASAAVSESFTPDPGKLYFDTDGAGWDMSTTKNKVAFYIFGGDFGTEDNPIEPVTWGGKKAIGSAVAGETGVFEFDPVAKEGLSFTPGVQYKIIFVHTNGNNWGAQTYDLYFTTDCFGKVAYADGTTTENPVDSSKSTRTAYWRDIDPEVNGPVLAITSIGNVVGSCPEQGKTKYDIFVDFISEPKTDYNGLTGLENARHYTVESNIKTEQQLIDDIADGLELTKEDVSRAFEESGVETTWSPDTEPSTEPPTEPAAGNYVLDFADYERGYAAIASYRGNETVVEVPSEIDGYKILAIGAGAFQGNTAVTKVTLPDTILRIRDYAFKDCTSLAEINIPESVCYPGINIFEGCTSLAEINIPKDISYINSGDFKDCSSLTKITIPGTVHSVYDGAFEGCTGLTDLYVNGDVSLDKNLFGNGAPPENLTIHGYTNSSAEAFANDHNIPFVSIGEVPESAHYGYSIDNGKATLHTYSGYQKIVEIPDTYEGCPVTAIDSSAFSGNTNIEEITLPDSLTEIHNYYYPTERPTGAFEGCTSLKKINIPDGVTEIVGNTFKGCTSLTEITIPDSVTTIEDSAFDTSRPLTIYGYAGSEAERYANDNGFTFVALSEKAILGDADGDGQVTALDATQIQRHSARMETGIPIETLMRGDVNNDGKLDVIDTTLIQRYLAKMNVDYPIGEVIA